jgi:meso-butanediol dehydrogenase/(S,S)-butanediol dehydrogenase/diacetyl reductase
VTSFAGKIALVTGAGTGIGRATALELADRGAAVVVLDLRQGAACETAVAIEQRGGRALPLGGDVGETGDVHAAVDAAVARFGGLDIVVANAGIEVLGTVLEVDEQSWQRIVSTNLTGVFLTAKHSLPHLLARGGGAFVAVASDAGVTGAQGYTAYAATKHGVVGIVRCLALDFGPRGIRANAVCPAFVETEMAERIFAGAGQEEREFYRASVPLGRFAAPEEIARAICHLASDEASYTNGLLYRIDGGATAGYFVGSAAGAAP